MSDNTDLKSLLAVPFSVIPGKDVEELWPGWFLKRHVTILVAPGGTGKGLLTCDMAARVSSGRAFPGEENEQGEAPVYDPQNVIMVCPEDDPNEALSWRLSAAGADMSRVFNLTILPDGSPFMVPDSVGRLHECMRQIEKLFGPVGLVIIDPLFAVTSIPPTTNANARRITTPLERLANETDACIVLTHHTVKGGKTAGVKALTDSVRCVLRLEREKSDDPENTGRILSVEKTNVLSGTGTIRYVIDGEGHSTHLVWPSEADHLSEALSSSRGYDIDPDLDPRLANSSPKPGDTVTLWFTPEGGESRQVGGYESPRDAKRAAWEAAGKHTLSWRSGPVEGSLTAPDGQGHYSVIPA